MRSSRTLLLSAAITIVAGSLYLAESASASVGDASCSVREQAYAEGYANGDCQASGYHGGIVTFCGAGTFEYTCW